MLVPRPLLLLNCSIARSLFSHMPLSHRPQNTVQQSRALLTGLLLAFALGGCSWFGGGKDDKEEFDDEDTSEQILYREGQKRLQSGNYQMAIRDLQRLEARFPFGRYAEQAQLELIYAHYMGFDHDAAIDAADRFIRLHPQHPKIDYAYYIKGLSAYDKDRSLLDRLFKTDASKRDASSARESYLQFAHLLRQYPTSQYAADARQRMVHLRNLLARAEIHVANYYMRRGAHIAAANRARYVVENYSKSDSVDIALALLVEANHKLGLNDAANDALRILAINYPQHDGFDKGGNFVLKDQIRNRDRSWLNLVTWGLLSRPNVPPPIELKQPDNSGDAQASRATDPASRS